MRRLDVVLQKLGLQVNGNGNGKTIRTYEQGKHAKTGRPSKYFDDTSEPQVEKVAGGNEAPHEVRQPWMITGSMQFRPSHFRSRQLSKRRHVVVPCKHTNSKKLAIKADPMKEFDFTCPCGDCVAWGQKRMHAHSEVLDMKQNLIAHGIDITCWGKNGAKSVWDLVWEQQHGQIQLKEERGKYTRFSRQLQIKLFAKTLNKGDCVLMEVAETTGCEGKSEGEDKFITKRMSLTANWTEECTRVLQADLGLQPEWQKRNLNLVDHRTFEEYQAAWKYPGLQTCYMIDEAHFMVEDPKAVDALGLPHGFDFATTTFSKQHGTEKQQHWHWEVEPFAARLLQRKSLVMKQEVRKSVTAIKRSSTEFNFGGKRGSIEAAREKQKQRASLQSADGDDDDDSDSGEASKGTGSVQFASQSSRRSVTFTAGGAGAGHSSAGSSGQGPRRSVAFTASGDGSSKSPRGSVDQSPSPSNNDESPQPPRPSSRRSVVFSKASNDESVQAPRRSEGPRQSVLRKSLSKTAPAPSAKESAEGSEFHGVGPSSTGPTNRTTWVDHSTGWT